MSKKKEHSKFVPELRFSEFKNLDGWDKKTFEELFTIGSGRDYKHLTKGDIPVYGTGGYMLSVNEYLYDGKSACIGRKGTINKPVLLSGKFWTVDTLFYTHSFKGCSADFVYLLFQNINWLKYNEAGGVPSLSKTIIYKIEVSIPKPKEQKKIIKTFTSLDDLIGAENEKLDVLKTHKKGLLQQLFPEKGEAMPELRFGEFKGGSKWIEKRIKNIFSIFQGFAFSSKDSVEKGTRWVKIADVGIQEMQRNNPSFLPLEFKHIFDKFLLKEGDYVLALTRPLLSGRLKIAPIDKIFNNSLLNQRVGKLVTEENLTCIYYLLQTNHLICEIEKRIAGNEPPNLSMKQIDNIELWIPSDVKEQQKIADCLSSLDNSVAAQSEKIEALNAHKKGLMQHLFPNIK